MSINSPRGKDDADDQVVLVYNSTMLQNIFCQNCHVYQTCKGPYTYYKYNNPIVPYHKCNLHHDFYSRPRSDLLRLISIQGQDQIFKVDHCLEKHLG